MTVTKLCASRRLIGPMAAALISLTGQAMGADERFTFSASTVAQETASEVLEVLVGDLSPLVWPCHIYVVPDSRGADFLAPRALEQLAVALVGQLRASSYGEGCGTGDLIFLSRPQALADSVQNLIQQLGKTDVRGAVLSLAYYRSEELVVLGRLDDLEGKIVASSGLLPMSKANSAAAKPAKPAKPGTVIGTSRKASSSATAPTDRGYRVQVAALRNETDARSTWRRMQANLSLILTNIEPYFERSETGSGVVYRVQIGSFPSRNEAAALCAELKGRKIDCFVLDR